MKQKKIINKKDGLELSLIPEQAFLMGNSNEDGYEIDKEGPTVKIQMPKFYMSTTTVTNKAFQKFVAETNYVTEAEKINSSFVFRGLLDREKVTEDNHLVSNLPWWVDMQGANWKNPEGPGSTIQNRMNHPVVHISWNDANAYCEWAGVRLPIESEWEVAARAGKEEQIFPWGDTLIYNETFMANTWQGEFPIENTLDDGYNGTAPVKEFYLNKYGLYQMIGNVWEWCLNQQDLPLSAFKDETLTEYIEDSYHYQNKNYAMRGGSFLCHDSYCNRYRTAARSGNSGNSSSSNTGFRYVKECSS